MGSYQKMLFWTYNYQIMMNPGEEGFVMLLEHMSSNTGVVRQKTSWAKRSKILGEGREEEGRMGLGSRKGTVLGEGRQLLLEVSGVVPPSFHSSASV